MGLEARCHGSGTAGSGAGTLLLETDELIFRGPARVRIPRAAITRAVAVDGSLTVGYRGGTMRFELGSQAAKWAERIRSPKSRLDKMGIRAGDLVSVVGIDDEGFQVELRASGARVSRGRVLKGSAAIVFGVDAMVDLDRLPDLRAKLLPAGGIWVVHRKGRMASRTSRFSRRGNGRDSPPSRSPGFRTPTRPNAW